MGDPRWLDAEAAAHYLCIRVDAFLRRVGCGIIPQGSMSLGSKTARWWSGDLDMVMRGTSDGSSTKAREMAQSYVERMEAAQSRTRRQANSS